MIDVSSNFSGVVWTENMIHFQSEHIFFKFVRKGSTLILGVGPIWGSNLRSPSQSVVLSEQTRRQILECLDNDGYVKLQKQCDKNPSLVIVSSFYGRSFSRTHPAAFVRILAR